MKKYIFTFLLSFCIGFSLTFLFYFIDFSSSASASSTEQNYDGVLSENFSTFNDLGLTSIEGLYVENGAVVYSCDFTTFTYGGNGWSNFIQWVGCWALDCSMEAYGNVYIQNNNYTAQSTTNMNVNFAIICRSSDTGGIRYYCPPASEIFCHTTLQLYDNYDYTIYFSSAPFEYNLETKSIQISKTSSYGTYYNYTFNGDFSSLLDFDSTTNFNLDVVDFPFVVKDNPYYEDSLAIQLMQSLENKNSITHAYYTCGALSSYPSDIYLSESFFYSGTDIPIVYQSDGGYWYWDLKHFNGIMKAFWFNCKSGSVTTKTEFYAPSFYFIIERPFSRVNNTLCIYNYNYSQILTSVEGCKYQLRLDNDYYTINYNGYLPSDYKYMYINAEELNNIIFDEYIYFYLNFDDDNVVLTSTTTHSTEIPFGFDFNFTFYTEPLVVNNQIYNYKFDKPNYVDMPFSLVPFYIPVLEIVENAIIFVVFYCPIIADIINLVGLNYIIGGLLQLITFLTDFAMPQLGTFIFGLFSFFVFMKFIQFIWPMAVNAGQGLYDGVKNAYHNSNRYRYKQENKKFKKEQQYKSYARKQQDKEFNKINKKFDKNNKE